MTLGLKTFIRMTIAPESFVQMSKHLLEQMYESLLDQKSFEARVI